ncbi:hypothetical protein [Streptomyces sp. SID13031]|uniref:hypothetical protein n=1 Tax=Streptomyces sp. SID13031 TaxID=2706046 RepID=UPI0013CCB058|nr:hypothetical protein [Streptomyces sp. SID13031]NEA36342.1 hypothetical protein [Streptomyces sp. SID13031]
MKNSRIALSLVAVLALAGCGANSSAADQEPVKSGDDKSPLAEYMGEGFSGSGGGGMVATRAVGGSQESSEEQLAKQRKMEDAVAACMKAAGFEYVAVPPESQGKSKFDEAFKLPPDKFAEQYGYGISTIDWGKPSDDADKDPNSKIRKALSPSAQKAYGKALNGQFDNPDGGAIAMAPSTGDKGKPQDTGCRGKAAEEVFGKADEQMADFKKFDSLFKDLEALRKRIEADQRVIDATSAWSDCLADAGHSGFKKADDPRESISKKLDTLTGADKGGASGPGKPDGSMTVTGPPSFDKVDAAKLADLRKAEIELAKADQGCKKKVYEEPFKKAQYELEKEFVDANKTQLEQYRDTVSER